MRKILGCVLVLMVSLLLVACGGKTVTPPSQSTPTPSPTATVASEAFSIPDDFDTYNDDTGLFSISYPEDWEVNLEILSEIKIIAQELTDSIRSGVSLENTSYLFMAGVPTGLGYDPSVNIVVQPLPLSSKNISIEAVADSEAAGFRKIADSYNEISRTFTIIDGRDAAIVEYKAKSKGLPDVHAIVMNTIVGRTLWSVTCGTTVDTNFNKYEGDFQAIVHSLKIYD